MNYKGKKTKNKKEPNLQTNALKIPHLRNIKNPYLPRSLRGLKNKKHEENYTKAHHKPISQFLKALPNQPFVC